MRKKIVSTLYLIMFIGFVAFVSVMLATGVAGFLIEDLMPVWTACAFIFIGVLSMYEFYAMMNTDPDKYECLYIKACGFILKKGGIYED